MSIPGFTAEAALGPATEEYTSDSNFAGAVGVTPARPCCQNCPPLNTAYGRLCNRVCMWCTLPININDPVEHCTYDPSTKMITCDFGGSPQ